MSIYNYSVDVSVSADNDEEAEILAAAKIDSGDYYLDLLEVLDDDYPSQ